MEIKGKVHCFFEQSGTFKRAFMEFGIPAEDYDIQNNFGETDHQIDLFAVGSLGAEKETRVPLALPRRASEKRWGDHRLCEHFPEEERGSGVPGRSWRLM